MLQAALHVLKQQQGLIRLISDTFRLESLFLLPVILEDGSYFNFAFYSRRGDAYNAGHFILADRLKYPLLSAMRDMLEMQGYRVTVAESGEEGLEIVRNERTRFA